MKFLVWNPLNYFAEVRVDNSLKKLRFILFDALNNVEYLTSDEMTEEIVAGKLIFSQFSGNNWIKHLLGLQLCHLNM